MRILPVLDLMNGQVVRGIAGRRHEYRPLCSPLAASAEPLVVARAFRDHFHLNELYVADLDAIAGNPPAVDIYAALQAEGFTLLVDAGLRMAGDVGPLLASGIAGIVAGLETVAGPDDLAELVRCVGSLRLVFSLDLKNGQPLNASTAWRNAVAWDIAEKAIGLGVTRLLVLDLTRVGVGSGTGTEDLCCHLKDKHPEIELLAGGGVRGPDDLDRLRKCSVDGVLVASALHDGRLRREDLH